MIEIKNLSVKIENKIIFENLNFKIESGEKILLKAPSGKGKTTFLRTLLGFVKKESGEIYFDENKMSGETISKIRKEISYVSQELDLPEGNVLEVIERIFNFKENKKIEFNLEKLKIKMKEFELEENILEKEMKNISVGERQRIGFIIALLLDRKYLFLDEVTASLNIELKKVVEEYILNNNKTVILISHDNHWNQKSFRELVW